MQARFLPYPFHHALLGLLAGSLLTLAIADWPAQAADAPLTTVLHLRATIRTTVPQEVMHIRLQAQADAADPVDAQSKVNAMMTGALDTLRNAVVDTPRGAVQFATGNYSVWSEALPQPVAGAKAPAKPTPPVWHAAQILTLEGTDLPRLLGLMADMQQRSLVMESMSFSASEEKIRAATDESMTRAVLRLREQAGKMASSLGMKVEQIREIRVGGIAEPRPLMTMARADMEKSFAAPVASPGEGEVSVTVEGDLLLSGTMR